MCRWRATYHWKVLDKDYNFFLDFISIGRLHVKLWARKVARVPAMRISRLHLGVLGQNAIWMWASWRSTWYIIRVKLVASPKSEPWWVLWIWICLWFILTPKVFQLCTNQLVVWFCACMREWLNVCHFS